MTQRIDLADANAEWLEAFKARFKFQSSWINDPKRLLSMFLSDQLGFSCDTAVVWQDRLTVEASEIPRDGLVKLIGTVFLHEGKELELKHMSSSGEMQGSYGGEYMSHTMELTFSPR